MQWRASPTVLVACCVCSTRCLAPSQEVAIVGDPADPATQSLLAELRHRYLPNTVVALKRLGEESVLPLLEGRELDQRSAGGLRLRELRLQAAGDDRGGIGAVAGLEVRRSEVGGGRIRRQATGDR
jgi:hypothetical protein